MFGNAIVRDSLRSNYTRSLKIIIIIIILFEMVCDEIDVLVSSVIQSHDLLRLSHMTFLMGIEEFV